MIGFGRSTQVEDAPTETTTDSILVLELLNLEDKIKSGLLGMLSEQGISNCYNIPILMLLPIRMDDGATSLNVHRVTQQFSHRR